jgi:hypothetical protein
MPTRGDNPDLSSLPQLARQYRWFGWAALGAVLFIVLTAAAMLVYPGGTPNEPLRHRYSFFKNCFSDLGRTRTFAGQTNRVSQVLFITAMVIGAAVLALFFRAFAVVTARGRKNSRAIARHLSHVGALFGIATAICFIGVACTPWDLFEHAHIAFALWAFRLFFGGVVLNLIAVLIEPALPRRAAWFFAAFAIMLIAYIFLLTAGLTPGPMSAAVIQDTGQKVIVYSAIVTVLVQSLEMRRHLINESGSAVAVAATQPIGAGSSDREPK